MRLYALVAVLALAGCGNPPSASTPQPPNSPQTTVALTIKTVADSASACVNTVIQLRDTAKKITPATATTIGNWCSFVAMTDKTLSGILANGQPWAQQKAAILSQLGLITAPALANTIDPAAQTLVAQIMTLVNQIKTQVQS